MLLQLAALSMGMDSSRMCDAVIVIKLSVEKRRKKSVQLWSSGKDERDRSRKTLTNKGCLESVLNLFRRSILVLWR